MKYHFCDEIEGGGLPCNCVDPPPTTKQCQKFFSAPATPDLVPDNLDEIILTGKPSDGKNQRVDYYYDNTTTDNEEGMNWGYCDGECYLESEGNGKLRYKTNINVLDESACQTFLMSVLGGHVDVWPKLLCVGNMKRFKFALWHNTNRTSYEESNYEELKMFVKKNPHVEGYTHSP